MGFLVAGESLPWEESLDLLKYIRDHGIEQFLSTFHAVKSVGEDLLRWGDEIEYGVVHLEGGANDPSRAVRASLRSSTIIEDLRRIEDHGQMQGLSESDRFVWMPEYGAWMLESTPGKPYEGLTSLLEVENNMMMRRSRLLSCLNANEIVPTLSCFPMLGVGESTFPQYRANGPIAQSLFIPDEAIFPHPRFPTLSRNIRKRRGEKVKIARPKFIDTETKIYQVPVPGIPQSVEEADALPYVYADAMAFGMGCCSLQATFQAKDLAESRHLYDHLAALTPVMLALSASTPILRGWLMDEDCRWDIVSEAVDDRTKAERGEISIDEALGDDRMAGRGVRRLAKSRFGPMDCYLCNCKSGDRFNSCSRGEDYNDVELVYDEEHFNHLVKSGVDAVLAKHVAHLFARDPLVIFPDRIELDDKANSDHWESLQSTNWQTVRWKPPPANKGAMDPKNENHIGWRVEFRSMEVQMTDFENAAFVVFVVLLSRVILGLELNTYIPISKLDENMRTAHKRNAVLTEKFWFRSNLIPDEVGRETRWTNQAGHELMTVEEIMQGKGDHFPGLVPLCRTYLDFIGCDSVTRAKVNTYLDFISNRASGKLVTNAAWIRQFVTNHPDYKHDSRVPQTTAYDLLIAAKDIGEGKRHEPLLTGDNVIPRIKPGINPFKFVKVEHNAEMDAVSAAQSACCDISQCRKTLLKTYVNRAIGKKVEKTNDILMQKRNELEKLQREIDELAASVDLMRSSSAKVLVTTPQGSVRLDSSTQSFHM